MTDPSTIPYRLAGRETLGLILVLGAAASLLRGLCDALVATWPGFDSDGFQWTYFLVALSASAQLEVALAIAGALLVAVGTGATRPGRTGIITGRLVLVVGVVFAALALVGIEEMLRQGFSLPGARGLGGVSPEADATHQAIAKAAMVLAYLPAAVIAGASSLFAWRWLSTIPGAVIEPEPEVSDA
jgi:hypothetical protein